MRLGVIGLGFMGSVHLKALRGVQNVELAAVCSHSEKALSGDLSNIQGNLGGPGEVMDFAHIKKFRDIEALFADPDIEAVDICLPSDLHAPVAIEAMRAGKHVLVEKPMALDGESAERMIEESNRNQRTLMTAQVLRFFPAYMVLRDSINQGQLGLIRSASFRRRCAAPAWGGGWLKDPARSGGGVFDLLIHDVDIAIHLFGLPETIQASGYQDGARGIDVIHADLFYAHGGVVNISGGWHHPKAFPFSMEYTVVADEGTIEYSSAGRSPALYRADGSEQALALPEQDGYAAQIDYFAECCKSGRHPEISPPRESADAVKLTRLMLEARNSNGERISCNHLNRSKSA
jgi:predicted dehydrogenase